MMVAGLQDTLRTIRMMLNNAPEVTSAIHRMIDENDSFKKQLSEAVKEKTLQYKRKLLEASVPVNGHNVIKITATPDFAMLRDAAAMIQKDSSNLVIAAAVNAADKPQLLLMYSPDLVAAGKNAGADIRDAARCIQGGGGGQSGLATAGGKLLAGLDEAMDKLMEKI